MPPNREILDRIAECESRTLEAVASVDREIARLCEIMARQGEAVARLKLIAGAARARGGARSRRRVSP